MSNCEKYPNWLRAIDTVIGVFSIGVAIWIIIDTTLAPLTTIVLLTITLTSFGFVRIAKAVGFSDLKTATRILNIVSGLFAVVLALVEILIPNLSIITLIEMIAAGLLILGFARILFGYYETDLVQWARIFHIIAGVIMIILSFIVELFPSLGYFSLIIFLSIVFVINGMARLIGGLTGELW